jgi:class 3 adenylate cyclase/ubiquinone/menaquinone biosynthesis C-methylase UbiE
MGGTGTMTVLFSDVVGSTDLLTRLGEREWDEVRRHHFSVLREALAEHEGTEVKNTGDGLMAVFRSAINAVDCAIAMQQQALQVVVGGTPVGLRIGIAMGEATHDHGDWFGTPVVEAARLCARAGTNESWATGLVQVLAGSQANARFVSVGPQSLKGFDQPVETFKIESPEGSRPSMFAQVDRHEQLGEQLVGFLDYWESLPSLQGMQAAVFAELAPIPGDVICDIGCGTGSELLRIARVVGPEGTAIGVDPSTIMVEQARDRAQREGVAVELLTRDGRNTALPDGSCDAVRIERVVQHVGDLPALLDEAKRITRPGGRIVIADTDWGSLIVHPGDRDLIRRFKTALETGPMAEPWAGRTLHDAMLAGDLTDVTSRMYPITAGLNAGRPPLAPMFDHLVNARLATRSEIDDLMADLAAAFERGGAVVAFTMFVASGRVPDEQASGARSNQDAHTPGYP